MREASIDAKPHHSLRGWQAFRIGDSIVLKGREAPHGGVFEELGSRPIEFFDSERAICIDENGVLWHIPANQVSCQDFVECTSELLDLLAEPRSEREIEALTHVEEMLLKILAAKRE